MRGDTFFTALLLEEGLAMDREFLTRIDDHLAGRSTLDELQAWLVENLEDILASGDRRLAKLANELDGDLIQLGEGIIDYATLVHRLNSYVRELQTIAVVYAEVSSPPSYVQEAGDETITDSVEVPGPTEVYRLSHQFA